MTANAPRFADRVEAWLRPRVPVARLDAVRALVGLFAFVYIAVRLRYFADLSRHDASQLEPVGVARLLTAPLPAWVTWAIALAALGLAAAFVAGRRLAVTAPLFFATLLWITTYRSSFGKVLHSENLLVLHVGVLALVPAFRTRSGEAETDEAERTTGDERAAGATLRTMSILTVLTYFVAGVAKLRSGGGAWLSGDALGDWLAFDTLRKIELGSVHSPLAPLLLSHRALLAVLATFTLVVELGAPLALLSRRAGRVWSALAWAFHVGILATMAIGFFYPISGVALLSFFDAERLTAAVRARLRRAPQSP